MLAEIERELNVDMGGTGLQAQRRHVQKYRALQKEAAAAFGRINGWRLADWFPARAIGCATRGSYHDGDHAVADWADHALYYRDPRAGHRIGHPTSQPAGHRIGRCIAIVGQPYDPLENLAAELNALRQRGLVVHIPPRPRASIHFPGRTLFLVVTPPGVTVRWLPEQMEAEVVAATA